jgi:hypothetical protein
LYLPVLCREAPPAAILPEEDARMRFLRPTYDLAVLHDEIDAA